MAPENAPIEADEQRPGSLVLATACLGAAAILLVVVAKRPPQTPCDPKVGLAAIMFAVAQATFVVGVGTLRRSRISSLLSAVLPLAWAMLAGAVLTLRQCAGDVAGLGRDDKIFGAATVLVLFILFLGLSMRLERAGSGALVAVVLFTFGLSLGWVAFMDGGVAKLTWRSWDAVNRFNEAVVAYQAKNRRVPKSDASFEEVALSLDAAAGFEVPRVDGWGHEIDYVSDGTTWEISSLGAYGDRGPVRSGPGSAYADDIVISNGEIVAWPAKCGAEEVPVTPIEIPPEALRPAELPVPAGAIDKRHDRRRR